MWPLKWKNGIWKFANSGHAERSKGRDEEEIKGTKRYRQEVQEDDGDYIIGCAACCKWKYRFYNYKVGKHHVYFIYIGKFLF